MDDLVVESKLGRVDKEVSTLTLTITQENEIKYRNLDFIDAKTNNTKAKFMINNKKFEINTLAVKDIYLVHFLDWDSSFLFRIKVKHK